MADELQSLPFKTLAAVLDDETKITSDRIQVLGANIPVAQIITYGVLILLCVQGYLLLHLNGLRGEIRGGKSEPIAWIGIYSDTSARIATLVSISLLPLLVVARLSMMAHLPLWPYVVQAVFSIGISVFLAVMSVIALIDVWTAWSTAGRAAE